MAKEQYKSSSTQKSQIYLFTYARQNIYIKIKIISINQLARQRGLEGSPM